jgi:hypothetical protein
MYKDKQKFALWVYPKTLERTKKMYKQDNCQSQSEFIEKAINFYLGYLESNENIEFLAPIITKTVGAAINNSEKRLASVSFKQAVGLIRISKILALFSEIDTELENKINIESVREAKRL